MKNGAFGIVMEPKTGAILAMASTPDFDPNHYAAIVNEELAAELEAIADPNKVEVVYFAEFDHNLNQRRLLNHTPLV